MTKEQQNRIQELREAGCGYKKISVMLNLPISTVQSFCKRKLANTPEQTISRSYLADTPGIQFSQQLFAGDAPNASLEGAPAQSKRACLFCGKVVDVVEGKRPRLFCSGACRTAHWRSKAKCVSME